jgi:hypothetical protein
MEAALQALRVVENLNHVGGKLLPDNLSTKKYL